MLEEKKIQQKIKIAPKIDINKIEIKKNNVESLPTKIVKPKIKPISKKIESLSEDLDIDFKPKPNSGCFFHKSMEVW